MVQFCKMLPLGKTGRKVHSNPVYYFGNFLWVFNYFEIKSFLKWAKRQLVNDKWYQQTNKQKKHLIIYPCQKHFILGFHELSIHSSNWRGNYRGKFLTELSYNRMGSQAGSWLPTGGIWKRWDAFLTRDMMRMTLILTYMWD